MEKVRKLNNSVYSEYLTKEALEGFGDFERRGQVIRSMK
jgi:hypothetical protein